jgi:hypothetical protein
LSETEKETLISKCKTALVGFQTSNEKIVVTADSNLFLEKLQGLNNIFAFSGKAVHIDSVADAEHSVYLKSFVDFYMLSEGRKIYSVGTEKMYKSGFGQCAAKVNDVPFERVLVQ